jgi:hypothetical protein
MLNIHRTDDVDSVIQNFQNILPSFLFWNLQHWYEPVHPPKQLRDVINDGLKIHFFQIFTFIKEDRLGISGIPSVKATVSSLPWVSI